MALVKLAEIARETGVSPQTVRRYYAKLPDERKQKCCNSFAVDEETRVLIIQQILSVPQNQNNNVATLLRSDSNEVLAYFERVIKEKDLLILDQQRQIGILAAKVEQVQLPPPDMTTEIKLTLKERLTGKMKRS